MKRLSTKRHLLSMALTLAASASAFAQTGGVEVREGDMYVGPVREVRVETATYVKQDGVLVEGPRKLSYTQSCSEDGKRCESESYAAEGVTRWRSVHVYDDGGRVVETNLYSGHDTLTTRIVRKPDEGEELYYYGDGSLRQRVVAVPLGDGTTDIKVYNARGALERTWVTKTGRGDGTLCTPPVMKRGDGMTVTTHGPGVKEFESAVVREDGTRLRTRERRERDEHGNLLKAVRHVWDAAAGDFVPAEVFYYTITYYR
jgi:hypothetical protein